MKNKEREVSENIGLGETIIDIRDLSIEYGSRIIFEHLNLSLKRGEKLALAGPNGAGKSTLIKTIMGLSNPDTGVVSIKQNIRVSYVPQSSDDIKVDDNSSIEDYVLHASGLSNIQEALQQVYAKLEFNPQDNSEIKRLAEFQENFDILGGYRIISETEAILSGMGWNDVNLGRKVGSLSSGEKTKMFIAQALACDSDLIILDEPTNHMDQPVLDWLGEYLTSFRRSVLVVSHDSDFLDKFVERVVEIVPEKAGIIEYYGNYSTFLRKKGLDQSLRKREIERVRKQYSEAKEIGNKLRAGSQAGVGRGRLTRAEKLRNDINELSVGVNCRQRELDIDFRIENLGPRIVLMASGIVVNWGEKSINLSSLDLEIERGQRLIISGGIGSGKSTLLDVIAGKIIPDEGEALIGDGISIGYFSQRHEEFRLENDLIEEIRSVGSGFSDARARSVLGHFLFTGDDQFKKVKVLSLGERSRLALAKLVIGKFNLLLIDEPTSHLDIPSRRKLIGALKSYNGTLLVASHDSGFLDEIAMNWKLTLPDCRSSLI